MKPFPPIIIDDFLTPASLNLLVKCISSAKKTSQPGYVRTDLDRPVIHLPRKKNKVSYVDPESISPLLIEIKNKIKESFNAYDLKLPSKFELGTPQLSFYAHGDYYGQHKDKTELGITFLLFPGKKTFSGGKIKFDNSSIKEASYKTNRAIIFSSDTVHEVTKVRGEGTRVSLQFFLTSEKAQKKFHNAIIQNRKTLKKKILRFTTETQFDLEEMMALKAEIIQFKDGTLDGVYQFLYFSCKGKLPSKTSSRIESKDGLKIIVRSKGDFELRVCVYKKKIWTEVSVGKKIFKFDFLTLSGQIASRLRLAFKA